METIGTLRKFLQNLKGRLKLSQLGQFRAGGLGIHLVASENRGPEYSTLNSRILVIRTPK